MDDVTRKKMMERALVSMVRAQERWLPDRPPFAVTVAAGEVGTVTRAQMQKASLLGSSVLIRAFTTDAVIAGYPLPLATFTSQSGLYLPAASTFYEPMDIAEDQAAISVGNLGSGNTIVVFLSARRNDIGETQ